MKCPFCQSEKLKVIEKRETSENSARRRRECLSCEKRFTTYERIEHIELFIIKKGGIREEFDREKIRRGISKAFEKRKVTQEEIDQIVENIESELRNNGSIEINSKKIGELIMDKLKEKDKVAYIRFASVYRDFKDVESFKEEINKLL